MPKSNIKLASGLLDSFRKRIVYEDNHLLAVDKKAGWLSQGDYTGDPSIIEIAKSYLKAEYNKPGEAFVGCVHRLDRPVSGLVLLAKTSKALSRLNKAFEMREVKKQYLALVKGRPSDPNAILIHYLLKNRRTRTTSAFLRDRKGAKRSELEYKLLDSHKGSSLLLIRPKTGRPHQIRTQLSKIGHPILGDLRYGYHKPRKDKSIALHAHQLELIHPVKKEALVIDSTPLWPEIGNNLKLRK